MRIVCVSDTHNSGRSVRVPDGDVLVHAGDLTFRGTQEEIASELDWLASLPHEHKIFVAGNHDWFFDSNAPSSFHDWRLERSRSVEELLSDYPGLTYLEDTGATVAGLNVWGSPWQPNFFDWAFNFPKDDAGVAARAVWSRVPPETQLLVTHSPPFGTLDVTLPDDERAGDPYLAARLAALPGLRLHVFGHLHESYGRVDRRAPDGGPVSFVNASINTRKYKPTNPPIIVDF